MRHLLHLTSHPPPARHTCTRRSEHEWLAFRAQAEQLAAANEVLQLQLEEAQADLDVSAAALASSRREFEALAAARSAQEVDMLRMKHEFETDEILVVALRQQVGVEERRGGQAVCGAARWLMFERWVHNLGVGACEGVLVFCLSEWPPQCSPSRPLCCLSTHKEGFALPPPCDSPPHSHTLPSPLW